MSYEKIGKGTVSAVITAGLTYGTWLLINVINPVVFTILVAALIWFTLFNNL